MAFCIDTENAIKDSIDQSVREVFSMMIDEQLQELVFSESDDQGTNPETRGALTVLLGLTGDIQGSLSLSLSDTAAIHWTRALIEHETSEVDQTVIDAVGELGNMVIGGAKRRLTGHTLTMSLPSVIRAGDASLVFPTNTFPVRVRYEFAGHPLTIVIATHRS
jgi:CheY-specific phosphatase CheX